MAVLSFLHKIFQSILRHRTLSTIGQARRSQNMKEHRDTHLSARDCMSLWFIALFLSLSSLAALQECYADSAEVLPQGKSAVFMEGKFYFPVTKQYDEDGNKEKVADKYNKTINGSVIPSLDQVGGLFGLPAGTANLGRTVVSYKYNFDIIEFNYGYGITDRLSFGTKIPYWIVKNNVDASLDTTNANFGLNPGFGGGGPLGAAPFVPIAVGGAALTTQQFQSLLGPGLVVNNTPIPGYGYKPVEKWDKQGFSDIEAFLRYQYYKSDNWRLAATGGVRMPTGWTDDPDSLVDYPSGTGAWAGLLRLNQDYVGTKDLFLSATLKFDYYFSDRNYERVPDNADQPLTTNKERVDRTYGPYFELELKGSENLFIAEERSEERRVGKECKA
jgi:hypothetical protein